MKIGPGSLKLVAALSIRRSLREPIDEALRTQAGAADVRHLADAVFLVYTEATTETIRGWLTSVLAEDEALFVVEFERWSSYGTGVDRDWLRERGH